MVRIVKKVKAVYTSFTMKRINSILLTTLLFFSATISVFAENAEISEPEAYAAPLTPANPNTPIPGADDDFQFESEKRVEKKKESSITIKTNVSGASVYLNGNYQGSTPLTVKNLADGRYKLTVSKTHYETRTVYVYIRGGHERIYYIDLERIVGRLSFSVTPSDATISCDGFTISANPITLDEGVHSVSVKRFGYNTWTSSVQVYRNMVRKINVSLDEAPFAITSIKSSRASFNPRNAGTLGQTQIEFAVTAPASGTLVITNSSGATVWSTSYDSFSTWNYMAAWNGTLQNGTYAPDGSYTATLTAAGQNASCAITIDSSISYPQFSITGDGTGLGSVGSALMYPSDTMILHFGLGPSFSVTDASFYGAPFTAQFAWTLTNWCEFYSSYNVMLGSLQTPSFYLGLKFGKEIPLSPAMSFCIALTTHTGYSKDALFAPYGVDIGNGFGTGVLLGLDTGSFYAGLDSQFIYHPVQSLTSDGDEITWKNGVLLQYRNSYSAEGIYVSLNSCFGSYSYTDKDTAQVYTGSIQSMVRAIDAGFETSLYFSGSSVSGTGKVGSIWYPSMTNAISEDTVYLYTSLGITIVF